MKFMKRKKISILLTSLFAIYSSSTLAADRIFINNEHFTVSQIAGLHSAINLNNAYAFKISKKIPLANGKVKYRLSQYYSNIPIYDASLTTTELQNGKFVDIFGSYFANIEKDLKSINPILSKKDVIKIALNNKSYTSQDLIRDAAATLYIMQTTDKKARLVYQVSFVNDAAPSRPFFIIDAETGQVLKQWEGLNTRDAVGPGGNEKTGKYQYGTDYGPLIVSPTCKMDNEVVSTINMGNRVFGGSIYQFKCPENTYKYINGAFSPLNDAHYFGKVIFDMYQQWFDISPLDFKLKMRVHFGKRYENAFWDGQQMTFGDGAETFYPLVSLDVSAHEVSHGFTEQNSGLVYEQQPGGINESFSDIAGEAAKYFANVNKTPRNDWLVGASIIKNGVALRYFKDPTLDGVSIGDAKDYYDGLDVHYSSGVFNKAFYLLATKTNWNVEKAFRAFVLANQVYWHPASDYTDAACGVYKASKDLGYPSQDVIDAFKAVSVDATCSELKVVK